jgi:hypothetical protein
MDEQEQGASLSATGLSPSVEPAPVSPADAASIPSADLSRILALVDDAVARCPYSGSVTPPSSKPCKVCSATARDVAISNLRCLLTSAIEARSGETRQRLDPKDESAVPDRADATPSDSKNPSL